eukprot:2725903-Prymnesium_polylepis.1
MEWRNNKGRRRITAMQRVRASRVNRTEMLRFACCKITTLHLTLFDDHVRSQLDLPERTRRPRTKHASVCSHGGEHRG